MNVENTEKLLYEFRQACCNLVTNKMFVACLGGVNGNFRIETPTTAELN